MNTFKTTIPASINSIDEAKSFLSELHKNGELYHMDDTAHDIQFETSNPTPQQRSALDLAMSAIMLLEDFDAFDYVLRLRRMVVLFRYKMKEEDAWCYDVTTDDDDLGDYWDNGTPVQFEELEKRPMVDITAMSTNFSKIIDSLPLLSPFAE